MYYLDSERINTVFTVLSINLDFGVKPHVIPL